MLVDELRWPQEDPSPGEVVPTAADPAASVIDPLNLSHPAAADAAAVDVAVEVAVVPATTAAPVAEGYVCIPCCRLDPLEASAGRMPALHT